MLKRSILLQILETMSTLSSYYLALAAVGGEGEKAGAVAATEGAQDSSAQWQGSQTKWSKLGPYYQFNDPSAEEHLICKRTCVFECPKFCSSSWTSIWAHAGSCRGGLTIFSTSV